jgi:periplasmic divalent cation tolerance protein
MISRLTHFERAASGEASRTRNVESSSAASMADHSAGLAESPSSSRNTRMDRRRCQGVAIRSSRCCTSVASNRSESRPYERKTAYLEVTGVGSRSTSVIMSTTFNLYREGAPMIEYCQVMTTVDTREAAHALARSAVEARVAACGQVAGPIASTYWWAGNLETAEEFHLFFKTTSDRYPALEEHIRAHHSYEVPEIICMPVTAGNSSYLAWLTAETHPNPS